MGQVRARPSRPHLTLLQHGFICLILLCFGCRNLSVAFGSQKAWLLNASFKENILFGEDENEEL